MSGTYSDLTRWEKCKVHVSYWGFRLMGWRPIETAPRDGTVVWVIEGHDDAYANVFVARWHTHYGSQDYEPPRSSPYWWGLSWRTGYQHWEVGGPWGRAENIAISPMWWKPMRKPGARIALMHYCASWLDKENR